MYLLVQSGEIGEPPAHTPSTWGPVGRDHGDLHLHLVVDICLINRPQYRAMLAHGSGMPALPRLVLPLAT